LWVDAVVVVTCETTMMPVAWEQVRSHVAAATESGEEGEEESKLHHVGL
jgi:hypothetical protein